MNRGAPVPETRFARPPPGARASRPQIAERFGIDSVGCGTDFHAGHSPDAITWWRAGRRARSSSVQGTLARRTDGFDSPAGFPGVLDGLRRRGFSGDDLRMIAGGNWLRLFRGSFGPMPA